MPRGVRATGYGAAGGRRDTKARSAKQSTRRDRRLSDPRVRDAMEETRKAQEALDAQMAEEARNPAIGHAEGALLKQQLEEAQAREAAVAATTTAIEEVVDEIVKVTVDLPDTQWTGVPEGFEFRLVRKYEPFDIDSVPAKAEGKHWVLGSARQMLIKGYSLSHVVQATGWGKDWFSDIPIDEDGYGKGTEAWLKSLEKKEKKTGLSK